MARKVKSFVGKMPIIIGLVLVVFVSLFMNIARNIEGVVEQNPESQQSQQDQKAASEFASIVITLLKDELNKTTYDNMTKQQIIDNINSVFMTQVQDALKQKFKQVVRQDKVNAVMKNIDLIFPKIKEYASPIIISNITAIIDKENFTNLENFIEGLTKKEAKAAAAAAPATKPIEKLRASDFSNLKQDISNEIINRAPEFINSYQTQMINNFKEL